MFSQGAQRTLQLFNKGLEINWKDGEAYLHSYKAENLIQRFYCDSSQGLTRVSLFWASNFVIIILSNAIITKASSKGRNNLYSQQCVFPKHKRRKEIKIVSAVTWRDQWLFWELGHSGHLHAKWLVVVSGKAEQGCESQWLLVKKSFWHTESWMFCFDFYFKVLGVLAGVLLYSANLKLGNDASSLIKWSISFVLKRNKTFFLESKQYFVLIKINFELSFLVQLNIQRFHYS